MKKVMIRIICTSIIRKIVFLFFFLLFSFSVKEVLADVIINEFSSASNPEWVELYNPTDQTISLDNLVLFFDANPDTTQKLSFCQNEQITAKAFNRIVRPSESYWLANDGDSIILKREDDIIDTISYGKEQSLKAPSTTQSASRPDEGSEWVILDSPTPQGDIISFACPTAVPTVIPTVEPTMVPTSSPTNTPTLTLTLTPTPTNTPTPKLTLIPTIKPTPTLAIVLEPTESLGFGGTEPPSNLSAEEILGMSDTSPGGEASSSGFAKFFKNIPWFPVLAVGIGVLFIGFSLFTFIKGNWKIPPPNL